MNMAHYANPEVDRLMDAAAAEISIETRYHLYQKIEEIVGHETPDVVLGHQNFYSLCQPWLKGPLMETIWPFRLDRVWLDR